MKALLKIFGEDLQQLNRDSKLRGVEYGENDIYLDVEKITPPPRIRGKLTSVRVEGSKLLQVFGDPTADPPTRRGNYLLCRGGTLRFGRLVMYPAHLTLIDTTPSDPFGYFFDEYKKQVAAGYSKKFRERRSYNLHAGLE